MKEIKKILSVIMVLTMILTVPVITSTGTVEADESQITSISTADEYVNLFKNGGSGKLTSNITVSEKEIYCSSSEDVELDLNGYTVTTTAGIITKAKSTNKIAIKNGKIIANSSASAYNDNGLIRLQSSNILDLTDVVLDGNKNVAYVLYVNGTANITMTNVTAKGGNNYDCIDTYTGGVTFQNGKGTVTLNNCTVNDNAYGDPDDQTAKDMFIGGEYKVTINGGTYGNVFMNQNYYSETHDTGYLHINDGTYDLVYTEYDEVLAHVVINAGHVKHLYINGDKNGNSQTGEIIKGGTFDKITIADAGKKLDDYTALGVKNIVSDDGKITSSKVDNLKVSIDGQTYNDNVLYRETVTLPSSDNWGYYYVSNGKSVAYKPGDEIKVTENMQLLSIDNISVSIDKKASIRLNDPTGLRFSAKVTGDEAILDQSKGIVTEGVLITSRDLFEQNGSTLTKDSKYKFIDVKNSGWLNNQIGNYAAAVVNIDKSNYTREFIATAYAQIHYQDGSVETIYGSEDSRYSNSRSVSYIAKQIKLDSNYYNSLSTTTKNIIDRFAR